MTGDTSALPIWVGLELSLAVDMTLDAAERGLYNSSYTRPTYAVLTPLPEIPPRLAELAGRSALPCLEGGRGSILDPQLIHQGSRAWLATTCYLSQCQSPPGRVWVHGKHGYCVKMIPQGHRGISYPGQGTGNRRSVLYTRAKCLQVHEITHRIRARALVAGGGGRWWVFASNLGRSLSKMQTVPLNSMYFVPALIVVHLESRGLQCPGVRSVVFDQICFRKMNMRDGVDTK